MSIGSPRRPAGPQARAAHPVLASLAAALDAAGVEWVALRVPSDVARPTGDVDLLVARRDAARLRSVAEAEGFVAMPGWDRAPNLILLRYDRPTDQWLVLDVVTAPSFADGALSLPRVTAPLLARRTYEGSLAVPDDADAFWLLLLHCLLDRGAVAGHYRQRLRRLAMADPGGIVPAAVRAAVPSAGGLEVDLAGAVRAGDWVTLDAAGASLRGAVADGASVSRRLRKAVHTGGRAARRPLLLPRRRGVALALLGPNGAGKSTLAQGLLDTLPLPVTVVYMGMWKDSDGLEGMAAVRDTLRRPLRVWRSYAKAQVHQLRGTTVVFDRYVHEARLPPSPPYVALKRPYLWLLAHACPRADVTVVLDLQPEVNYARKQENPPEELARERRVYAQLAREVSGVRLVDAARAPGDVRADVTELLWRRIAARWTRTRAW